MTTKRPKRTRLRAAAKAHQPPMSIDAIKKVEGAIGYRFQGRSLLVRALTHPSALGTEDLARLSNQRLEFLGDRVLGLVIAERLMERYPTDREGDLAPKLNMLVNKGACAAAVQHLEISQFIIMASSEIASGGRERESTQGDMCEALIGAIYLDGGIKPARAFIERAWAPQLAKPMTGSKDAKNSLQEWAQQRGWALPEYQVTGRDGPDHAPEFEVTVTLQNGAAASASGPSKQEAQRAAAAALLSELENE